MNTHLLLTVPLCGIILLSSFDIACAASPPELTVLRQQYDKVVAERVTAPFDASLAELNVKYGAGLERAIADAKAAGKLEDILAIEAEKKRLTDKLPVPATDDESEPEALKKFRGIYREQLAALSAKRDQSQEDLLAPYTAKLKELEAVLVKNDRVDEAKDVLAYRNGLGQGAPLSPLSGAPTAPGTPNPPTTAAGGPAAPPPAVPKGKGDDRKAAEWVVTNWSEFRITLDTNTPIKSKEDLPKGKFAITSLAIDGRFFKGGQVTAADLQVLAGLGDLKSLTLSGFPDLKDTDLAFVSTLSALEELKLTRMGITDDVMRSLSNLRALAELSISECGSITGVTFDQLAGLRDLTYLYLFKCAVGDEGVASIAKLSKLLTVNVTSHSGVTDASLLQLRAMPALTRLMLSATSVTPEALGAVPMPKVTSLSVNSLSGKPFSEIAPMVAPAFPNVNEYQMAYQYNTPEDLAALAHFKNLEILSQNGYVKDEAWPGLLAVRDLREFRTNMVVSDASFIVLAKLKKLKRLDLGGKTPSAAALAAFKKQRPDVQVDH